MSVYTRSIALAKRMIQKYAQVTTPWILANEDQSAPVVTKNVYIVFKTTNATFAFLRFISNSNVAEGNVDAIMAVQDFTPTLFDTVVRNGVNYTIKSLDPVQPGNELILWRIELNK